MRYDIRLSGSGGQGIITMGIILADAIGLHEGKYVAQTQSYGPEARGGSSRAEVVVSDEEIDYPKAMELDLLLVMNQKSCDEYYRDLKPGGTFIVDSTFVTQFPVPEVFAVPFTRIARERLKSQTVANIVALGALSQLTGIVSKGSLEKALLSRMPKEAEALNREALRAGVAAAKRIGRDHALSQGIAWENEDL